ncbi:MAG: hypothetical protein R2877_08450 [Bdellovibrionota bacterium]
METLPATMPTALVELVHETVVVPLPATERLPSFEVEPAFPEENPSLLVGIAHYVWAAFSLMLPMPKKNARRAIENNYFPEHVSPKEMEWIQTWANSSDPKDSDLKKKAKSWLKKNKISLATIEQRSN